MHDSGWEKFSKTAIIVKCIVLSGLWELTTHDAPGKASYTWLLQLPLPWPPHGPHPSWSWPVTHSLLREWLPNRWHFPWHQPVAGNLVFLCGPNCFSPAAIWQDYFSRTRWDYSFVEFGVKIFTKGKLNTRHFRNTFLWLLHIVLLLPHPSQD